jgi:hypothetical protein
MAVIPAVEILKRKPMITTTYVYAWTEAATGNEIGKSFILKREKQEK